MTDSIVIIFVGGGLICMLGAYWLWRRGQHAPRDDAAMAQTEPEQRTAIISKDDLFDSQTVYLSANAAARAAAVDTPDQAEAATEFVPREEIFRVADQRQASAGALQTEVLSKDQMLDVARGRPADPPPGTEG